MTKAELVAELAELRARIAETEDRGLGPRLFRDLMDQSGDILAVVDPQSGCLLDANGRMSELLGYDRSELLTMKVMDFDAVVSDQDTFASFIVELRLNGSLAFESVLRRKDGESFPVEVTARLSVDGQREFMVVVARDITDRKQAEGALRKSREMAQSLLNATRDLVFLIDPEGSVRDLNEAAVQAIGLSRDQLLNTNIFSYFPPAVSRVRKMKLAEILATGKAGHLHEDLDGKAFDTYLYPLLDEDDAVESLAVYVSDVTAHKNAQDELRAERVFIEAALDATADMFVVFDTNSGKPLRWNRVLREVSGYSDAEIAGMKAPDDFFEEGDLGFVESTIRELSETTSVRVDLRLLTKDGRKIPYDFAITMIESAAGAASLACSVGRDVAEQRLAEEALRHSERTHRGFVDSLNAGVVAHAPDSTTLYWNRKSLQLLGLTEDQMRGRTSYDPHWHFLNEDGSVMAVEDYPLNLTLRTQSDLYGYVAGIVRPVTNDVLWVLCNSHRSLADNGELEHVLVSFLDITELRNAGEERRSLEAQVLHAQKLESLGVLAGGIAHDFNNLLMTILGNTDLALHDLSITSPVRPNIEEVSGAARRAADLVKQMLAYSGRGHFVVAPLGLNELVEEMVDLLKSSIAKKVSLVPGLTPGLPAIEADSAQIQQVIMNLITNASESITEGDSGTISFATYIRDCGRDYLAESCTNEKPSPGRFVVLEVEDTGCGMDEKTKASLFDPFFTTKFAGRGLGMAAVLGIVRGHNGAIMVESQSGVGTVFRVLFPALTRDVKAPETAGETAKRTKWQGAGTVLVVDDDQSVLATVSRMVARLGFKILTAADGQEAVEVFREHADEINCVLIDLTMPRMDGGEACLAIRRIRRDAIVILSSGYGETELSERFDGYDFAGFVQKPYKLKDLREILQAVLAAPPQ